MKTSNRSRLLIAGVCALALCFGATAYAEKGAETLAKLTKSSAPAKTELAPAMPHNCPTCTDNLAFVVDKGTKGPNHLVTKVVRHNCKSCDTTMTTEGVGKTKRDVAVHSCNAQIKPLCCAQN